MFIYNIFVGIGIYCLLVLVPYASICYFTNDNNIKNKKIRIIGSLFSAIILIISFIYLINIGAAPFRLLK